MSDIIDITVQETIDVVDITVNPNIIEVNVTRTSGGGGSQTLAQTLDLGNQTGGENIVINNADAIELENTSLLQKGTYNFGGNGGISRICSNQYEDMWQNGFRHVFDQSGFIRNSSNGFDLVPDSSFDVTLRFKVGSFWTLDNGTTYICTDNTEGAAEWEIYSVGATPTLQQVTDEGATTTNDITVSKETGTSLIQIANNDNTLTLQVDSVSGSLLELNDANNNNYGSLSCAELLMTNSDSGENVQLNSNYLLIQSSNSKPLIELSGSDFTLTGSVQIKTDLIDGDYTQQLPDKSGTFAMLSDIAGGGGASISFYLNGSVSQGTIGGVAFREMDRTPILGAGTDFTINANGYIQSFITDAGVPNLLEIPAGNWNFETYFSASSGGGSPSFYVELYKWNGTTLSLIASNSANPEFITGGTNTDLYVSALAVPQTTLLATDRLAVRIYVTHSSKTITLHTENSNLCQVITTFSTGLTALNALTAQVQNLATGTSGTDFGIVSSGSTHTFNLPNASASNRGALSAADWSAFNAKQNNLKTFNTTQGIYYFEEFLGQSRHVDLTIGNNQGSSAYTATITNRTNQQGVVQHTTSANASGQAGFTFVNGAFQFIGAGVITLETYINITTLSTLAERFYTFFGYVVGSNFVSTTTLITIVYDEGGVYQGTAGSPNFKCFTKQGGAQTFTVTSVPVVAAQWYKLRIVINAAASSVEFYIDNVLVATHTTNIPATTTPMYIANGIVKTTGTSARSMQTDYFMYEQIFTNPR